MNQVQQQTTKLENSIANVFKNAPHVWPDIEKVVITALPWVALVLGIIQVVRLFDIFKVFRFVNAFWGSMPWWIIVGIILAWLMAYFFFMAFTPLQSNKKSWRNNFFYALLVWALNIILVMIMWSIDIVQILILLAGLYLLFEVRKDYK